jgi:hypothetical protein
MLLPVVHPVRALLAVKKPNGQQGSNEHTFDAGPVNAQFYVLVGQSGQVTIWPVAGHPG